MQGTEKHYNVQLFLMMSNEERDIFFIWIHGFYSAPFVHTFFCTSNLMYKLPLSCLLNCCAFDVGGKCTLSWGWCCNALTNWRGQDSWCSYTLQLANNPQGVHSGSTGARPAPKSASIKISKPADFYTDIKPYIIVLYHTSLYLCRHATKICFLAFTKQSKHAFGV